jgi:4-amino-4-deoxy-L-arabinose transferase-like glycosyltransferase
MSVLALFNHALNFLAPALWLALLLPLASRIIFKRRAAARTIRGQAALLFAVGVLVLLIGLVVFGRDGKMLTYLALVLAGATAQWVIHKGH